MKNKTPPPLPRTALALLANEAHGATERTSKAAELLREVDELLCEARYTLSATRELYTIAQLRELAAAIKLARERTAAVDAELRDHQRWIEGEQG